MERLDEPGCAKAVVADDEARPAQAVVRVDEPDAEDREHAEAEEYLRGLADAAGEAEADVAIRRVLRVEPVRGDDDPRGENEQ